MSIHAEAADRSTTVDPAKLSVKLLETVRRWCPGDLVKVPISLVKLIVEAAASGCIGEQRLGVLEEYVLGLDAHAYSNSQKVKRLKTQSAAMADNQWHVFGAGVERVTFQRRRSSGSEHTSLGMPLQRGLPSSRKRPENRRETPGLNLNAVLSRR
jgi:hypothetical protein